MDRREYLAVIGTGVTVGIAGCGAPGAQTETEGAGTETETETTVTDETTAGTQPETETGTETGMETEVDTETGTEVGTTGEGEPTPVTMVTEDSEYYFDPIGLYVESGTTVTWVNESGSHSSTAYTEDNPQSEVRRIPGDAEGWDSGTISEEGAEFTHTFDVEGTYDYYCIPHKTLGMVGRVVVGEPSGVDDDPPDGAVPSEQAIVDQGAVPYDQFEGE